MKTRTRFLDFMLKSQQVKYDHTSVTNVKTSYTYSAHVGAVEGTNKTMVDVIGSEFKKQQARGTIVLNPMSLVNFERAAEPTSYLIGPHSVWGTRIVTGDQAAFIEPGVTDPLASGTWKQQLKDLALTQAYANVDPNVILGGELLATLDQSVGMLRRPFKGMSRLLGQMHKHKNRHLGKTAASEAKAIANAWLEYRYGWQPLLRDVSKIQDMAEHVRQNMTKRRLVARAHVEMPLTKTASFSHGGGIPQVDSAVGTVRSDRLLSADAGVIYDVSVRTVAQAMEAAGGLRVYNGAATAWELVPWSFVADWFVNIGTWLQAVTPNPYITCRGNWVTEIEDKWIVLSSITGSTRISTSPATTYTGPLGGSTRHWNYVTRTVDQSLPYFPTAKPFGLSRLKQADAMALALNPLMGSLRGMRN